MRDELVIGQVDDDVLVYDPVSDRTTVLNWSAAAVLDLCDGERTVAQIIGEVGRAIPAPSGDIGTEIEEVLRTLAANGLFANAPSHSGRELQPPREHCGFSGLSCHSLEPERLELRRQRRALVCYLDEAGALIKQGKALLESLIYIDAQDTDLILFGPPAALQQFPDHPLVTKIPQQPHFLAAAYGYINSIACLAGPSSNVLDQYGYLLKTDLDVFLTPGWNNFRPEQFTTGPGTYSHTDEVRNKCRQIAAKFGLNHYGRHNLGSTFYGPPERVRDVCRLATMLCEYLLTDEFATDHGSWPHWYRGVASMYATEIAINHLVPELAPTSSQLDVYSTSSESVTDHAHVHCWHSNGRFSKGEWEAGNYASVDISQLDMKIVRDYCMAMALRVSTNQDEASLSLPGKTHGGGGLASLAGAMAPHAVCSYIVNRARLLLRGNSQNAQENGMSLTTDGNDYEVLARAAAQIKGVPGLVLEIGTRRGGSAKIIVDALQSVQDVGRTFILLDPYGNIPYNYNPSGNELAVRLDYTNQMQFETIPELLRYGWERHTSMTFLNLEDTEYMARFADYVPVYNEVKYREARYALVYYDGPHDVTSILKQTRFCVDRSRIGTRYVYDDHTWYDHGIINEYLIKHGFALVELVGQKVSYVRTK